MSVLLAAIGVLVFGGGASTSQVPRFGGLYLFEAGKYTYPNGETWGPSKGYVFMSQTDKSETLIYLPGSRNPFIGLVSANFVSAKSEVLGIDFPGAPSSIQRQISERLVQRDLSLAISEDARRLRGKLELFDVKWTGDTLDRITPHEHDVTFTRVECQVKDFQFVVQDFDKVAQQHLPERAKQVADAEALQKNSIANFTDSLLQMQKTMQPIADA
ncbi:MAG: hypothetical protein H7Y17_16520, partial [Chlorobia bacterium]|nr:hypothetical protein [Fimbriimonadaceae bacterium]